jgi:uncharacterized protein
MKVSVRDIGKAGLDLIQSFPKEGIGLSDEEIDLRSPIEVKVHLERFDNTAVADVVIKADFGSLCARCLEDMHQVQTRNYHFDFELGPTVEHLDLGEEIRQELIMDNPARVLCTDDCKGICPSCGVNLNTEQCQCPASP